MPVSAIVVVCSAVNGELAPEWLWQTYHHQFVSTV